MDIPSRDHSLIYQEQKCINGDILQLGLQFLTHVFHPARISIHPVEGLQCPRPQVLALVSLT